MTPRYLCPRRFCISCILLYLRSKYILVAVDLLAPAESDAAAAVAAIAKSSSFWWSPVFFATRELLPNQFVPPGCPDPTQRLRIYMNTWNRRAASKVQVHVLLVKLRPINKSFVSFSLPVYYDVIVFVLWFINLLFTHNHMYLPNLSGRYE